MRGGKPTSGVGEEGGSQGAGSQRWRGKWRTGTVSWLRLSGYTV